MLLVVMIHADNRELWEHGAQVILSVQGEFANWLRELVSQVLARVAVPLFFAISGYLLLLNFPGGWDAWWAKWKRRAQSLLLPFLVWNALAVLVVTVVGGRPPWAWGISKALNAGLGITSPMFLFHLWFLRDLIVFVVLAPGLYFLAQRVPFLSLCVIGSLHVLGPWQFPWPSSLGLWYFFFGCVLAVHHWRGEGIDSHARWWLAGYALLAFADSLDAGFAWSRGLHELGLFVGCGAWLALAGFVERRGGFVASKLEAFAPASFFLYLAHEPLLRYLRYALNWLIPSGIDDGAYLLYWVPPLLAVAICTALYFTLFSRVAWLHKAFCGGR